MFNSVNVTFEKGKFVYIERSEINRCMFILQQKKQERLSALLQKVSTPPRSKRASMNYTSAQSLIELDRNLYESLQKEISKG
ncbi:MAG: hypothetical protein LBM93_05670 [Oscillospiraceae bacterium]|nr:hypothetical protein [Oscillospiraceae bacterium]